ncbi:hypothetical protein Ais01nite_04690 [Asanoa ishikariensis]|uniref:Uncharacterized protein n=1 Tax=Asanoa ishikariensis TaxID=137265 RepID=A0A1H3TI21_9ACTN|nr:hypothetical protein [Asanoa ishikariensis]GIF62434.1 hypothetical protein Ais01nite_04690 [Asanoa ishikariensis]SDZ49637.1 hypothetical protein SAMN05421684_5762 [Asanoa ishikariensis]
MFNRRWAAAFVDNHLVIERRRLLPWSKPEVRRIPLAAVRDVRSLSATDWQRRRARVTVQEQNFLVGYDVRFAAVPPPVDTAPPRPPAPPVAAPPPRNARVTSRPVRAGDGRRPVWLWPENGRVHASLSPVSGTTSRNLTPAGLARLLLAEPARSMPAIRAVTGIDDDARALACMRTWEEPPVRIVTPVDLSAADAAGRNLEALQRPAGMDPDGNVRTVSGGLPGLGKRHG